MSICITLYKPCVDVKVIRNKFIDADDKNAYVDSLDNLICNDFEFSDGRNHDIINLTDTASTARAGKWSSKNWRRYYRRIINKFDFQRCNTNWGVYRVLPVEVVKYWQGWGIKRSFCVGACTFKYFTTKKQVECFFKHYGHPEYQRDIDTFKQIIDTFEDGMILEVRF